MLFKCNILINNIIISNIFSFVFHVNILIIDLLELREETLDRTMVGNII